MKEIKLLHLLIQEDFHKHKISLVDIIGQSDHNIFHMLEYGIGYRDKVHD